MIECILKYSVGLFKLSMFVFVSLSFRGYAANIYYIDDLNADLFTVELNHIDVKHQDEKIKAVLTKRKVNDGANDAYNFLNKIKNRQKNSKGKVFQAYSSHFKTDPRHREKHLLIRGAEPNAKDSSFEPVGIAFVAESEGIIKNYIEDNVLNFKELEKGLDFSFDFSTILSPTASKSKQAKKLQGPKYDLVLKDFEASQKNLRASVNSHDFDGLSSNSPEDPFDLYTIGPVLNKSQSTTLGSLKRKSYTETKKPFTLENLFRFGTKPSTRMSGKVAPEKLTLVGGSVGGYLVLAFNQEKSLYSMRQKQKIGSTETINSYHTSVPINNVLKVGHDFDEDFTTTHTHLMTRVRKFESRFSLKGSDNSIIHKTTYHNGRDRFSFNASLPSNWTIMKGIGKDTTESYSFSFSTAL